MIKCESVAHTIAVKASLSGSKVIKHVQKIITLQI